MQAFLMMKIVLLNHLHISQCMIRVILEYLLEDYCFMQYMNILHIIIIVHNSIDESHA